MTAQPFGNTPALFRSEWGIPRIYHRIIHICCTTCNALQPLCVTYGEGMDTRSAVPPHVATITLVGVVAVPPETHRDACGQCITVHLRTLSPCHTANDTWPDTPATECPPTLPVRIRRDTAQRCSAALQTGNLLLIEAQLHPVAPGTRDTVHALLLAGNIRCLSTSPTQFCCTADLPDMPPPATTSLYISHISQRMQ